MYYNVGIEYSFKIFSKVESKILSCTRKLSRNQNSHQKYFSEQIETKFYRVLKRTDSMQNPSVTAFSGSHRIKWTNRI